MISDLQILGLESSIKENYRKKMEAQKAENEKKKNGGK